MTRENLKPKELLILQAFKQVLSNATGSEITTEDLKKAASTLTAKEIHDFATDCKIPTLKKFEDAEQRLIAVKSTPVPQRVKGVQVLKAQSGVLTGQIVFNYDNGSQTKFGGTFHMESDLEPENVLFSFNKDEKFKRTPLSQGYSSAMKKAGENLVKIEIDRKVINYSVVDVRNFVGKDENFQDMNEKNEKIQKRILEVLSSPVGDENGDEKFITPDRMLEKINLNLSEKIEKNELDDFTEIYRIPTIQESLDKTLKDGDDVDKFLEYYLNDDLTTFAKKIPELKDDYVKEVQENKKIMTALNFLKFETIWQKLAIEEKWPFVTIKLGTVVFSL